MQRMRLEAIYPKSSSQNRLLDFVCYPYLLPDVTSNGPIRFGAPTVTYVRLREGFVYLVAILDWPRDGVSPFYRLQALIRKCFWEVNPDIRMGHIGHGKSWQIRSIGIKHAENLLKAAIGAAGIVVGAPVLRLGGAWAQAPAEGAGTLKLADDLFVLRLPGEANVIAQTSADGVLLVDGGSAAGSDALLKAIAALPNGGGKIHTLFNTHWHPEQTGLNQRLGTAGATIVAHENTRLWLTQNVTWPWNGQTVKKLAKVAQPNKTFYQTGKLDILTAFATDTSPMRRTRTAICTSTSRGRTSSPWAARCPVRAGPRSTGGPAAGLAASSAASSDCRPLPTRTHESWRQTGRFSRWPTSGPRPICSAPFTIA